MFGQLFVKECRQTSRSLIYYLYLACIVLFFVTQMGGGANFPQKPQLGQDYGQTYATDEQVIMEQGLISLVREYSGGTFVTYPLGFYKQIHLNKEEKSRVGGLLQEMTGIAPEELQRQWLSEEPGEILPKEGLTFEEFQDDMGQVDKLLGGGSSYSQESLKTIARVPKTYEQAYMEYEEFTQKDRVSGSYARLFCDYMGIMVGILPVFLAVASGLRDRRARVSSLIYSRKASSWTIMGSRYLAMVVMMFVPLLLLSLFPLGESISYAKSMNLDVDIWAFLKYGAGWLLPEMMTVTALGMVITELTDTALAVLVQAAWWFIGIFAGVSQIGGGGYGWSLVLRHNTLGNYQLYREGLGQIICNRAMYVLIGILLAVLSVWIYSLRRKGRLDIRGKILANRKRKS